MSVRSGQSVVIDFVTQRFDTGNATAADSTPTGTLVVNGTDDAASVTVISKTGGKYKAQVTLPTLAVGDVVQLRIAATVNAVAGVGVIWTDVKDIDLTAAGKAPATLAAGDIAADAITDAAVASDVTIASVTGAVGSVTGAVGSVTGSVGSVTGAVGSVTGNVGGNVVGSVGSVGAGGITTASFGTGAIDANALATDAVTEIQTGLSTLDAAGVRAAIGMSAADLDSQLDAIAGYIDTEVGTINSNLSGLITTVGVSGAGLTSLGDARIANLDATVSSRATPAQVNSEVLDVFNVDTYAEIGQEAPAATTTLRKMLGFLYKAFRTKKTQTASQFSLFNDDGITVDQKAVVSDDGTTTTVGELASGP